MAHGGHAWQRMTQAWHNFPVVWSRACLVFLTLMPTHQGERHCWLIEVESIQLQILTQQHVGYFSSTGSTGLSVFGHVSDFSFVLFFCIMGSFRLVIYSMTVSLFIIIISHIHIFYFIYIHIFLFLVSQDFCFLLIGLFRVTWLYCNCLFLFIRFRSSLMV